MQDNFKLTPNVTLEGGLRFEWNGTPVEGANRFTIFNPANVTLTQAGTNGLSANAAYKQNYNLEPRLGFAADVFGTGKTVIRGGYAYLVDQPVSGVVTALASNPPFSTTVSYNDATAKFSVFAVHSAARLQAFRSMPSANYKNGTSRASILICSRPCHGGWWGRSATTDQLEGIWKLKPTPTRWWARPALHRCIRSGNACGKQPGQTGCGYRFKHRLQNQHWPLGLQRDVGGAEQDHEQRS